MPLETDANHFSLRLLLVSLPLLVPVILVTSTRCVQLLFAEELFYLSGVAFVVNLHIVGIYTVLSWRDQRPCC